ncbi:hypothetical protein IFM89_006475 [Coptis chinensis]|uniref:Endonuclease/exonuclease/phosphatase domain-containing protein n=1 Tax=Coptis chinensis TaxID=261450 RepID=A0A835IPF3_9MAGN|nr:hypothetical protein IFM89_006475 [Coptis chinensis]
MSATNGVVVTRDSSSSTRMSARSPTSLVGAVVSRESPSTVMAIVGSPFSPPLSRPSQSLTRYSKDSASSLGPLLATPNIPRLLRTADGSSLNNLTGNSFTMRNSALVMEEDGIDDDISETHEEPFDDHIVDSPQVTRLSMPSQVVTRAQLQQQHLQNSRKRGRGRAKGLVAGRIWFSWDPSVLGFQKILESDQFIHAQVTILASAKMFHFTVVYTSNKRAERLILWEDLISLKASFSGPWCVVGDFNNALYSHERIGTVLVHPRETTPFANCLNTIGLYEHKSREGSLLGLTMVLVLCGDGLR